MKIVAEKIVDRFLKDNSRGQTCCMVLALIFTFFGIILGILAYYQTLWFATAEILIGVGLVWSIKGLIKYAENNKHIMEQARITIREARDQVEIKEHLQ